MRLASWCSGEGALVVPISRPYKRVLEVLGPINGFWRYAPPMCWILNPWGRGWEWGAVPPSSLWSALRGSFKSVCLFDWSRECYTLVVSDQWLLLQFRVSNGHQCIFYFCISVLYAMRNLCLSVTVDTFPYMGFNGPFLFNVSLSKCCKYTIIIIELSWDS